MITVLILLILLWQFYLGYARGFFLQLLYTIGHVLAIFIAGLNYQSLANTLTLWVPYANAEEGASVYFFTDVSLFDLGQVFYSGVAFILCYTAVYLFVRFLGVIFHVVKWQPLDSQLGKILAGTLSLLVSASVLTMLLSLLATIPYASLQNHLNSGLAKMLIDYNPITSQLVHYYWITNSLG